MYDLWLSILKVIAEGLTAVFGILGLLTTFRDEATKKITRMGKVALIGILSSFAVSGAIAALEFESSKASEISHEKEIRRVLLPWNGQTKARIRFYFSSYTDETSDYLRRVEGFLNTEAVEGFKGPLPSKLGAMPQDFRSLGYRIYLVRNKTCETADFGKPDTLLKADFSPLENDPEANWEEQGLVYLTRSVMLSPIYSNGNIDSIEDFKGTTILLHSEFPETNIYVASSIELSFPQGTTISTHLDRAGTSSFCATFPASRQ
jgi:hypothetical protein